jgi:drug/metabolite transporter (DMT)-like permease
MNLKETAALVLLAAVWGGSFLFIRIAVPALGPLPLMAARVLIAGAVLWGAALALGERLRLRAHARGLLLLGVVNAAIPFTLIAWAELHLSASLASLLNSTVPLFAALVGMVWLRERLARRQSAGLLLGVVGVGVLVGWSPVALTGRGLLSVGAMLAATLCYAVAAVYTRKELASASASTLAVGQQLAAGALLLLPGLWQLPPSAPPRTALWAVGALAVLSTAVAYLLYFYLIGRVGPTKANTVTFLIPVFGMSWGAIFLDEPLTGGMFAGLACILAGMVLVNGVPSGSPGARSASHPLRYPGRSGAVADRG